MFEAVDLLGDAFKVVFDSDYGGESGAGGTVSAINGTRDRTPDIRWNRSGAISRASGWRGKGVAEDLEFEDVIDIPNVVAVIAGWFSLEVVRRRIREEVLSDGFKYCKDSIGRRGSNRDL